MHARDEKIKEVLIFALSPGKNIIQRITIIKHTINVAIGNDKNYLTGCFGQTASFKRYGN